MTTGRINQVAFLGDTTTRTIPDADETRGRDGRGSRSFRARAARNGRSRGRRPPRRHRILHPKARAIARGPVRRESARLEHGRRCWARPAPPGRRAAERDSFTFEFHRSGYAAQEPRLAARHPGPWAESDGGSRPTVRCTSTEPADTDSPITAHATLRTRDNNPDERTTATRASGNTRERSCPHRWTRKDLEGTSNTPLGDAKDLEGTSNKPRGTRRISKGHATSRGGRGGSRRDRPRGEQQGQSFGGPSASARKTEARPRQQARHATSSGIARRANAWARARQFNATPTPA